MSTKALVRTINSLKSQSKKVTSQIEMLAKTQLVLMSNLAVLEGHVVANGGQPAKAAGVTVSNRQRIRAEKAATKKEKAATAKPAAKTPAKTPAAKPVVKAKAMKPAKVKTAVNAKTPKKPVKENAA